MGSAVRIDRASPGDLAMGSLASRRMPEQFGAIVVLDTVADFDLSAAEALLAERVRGIARFRQTLVPVARLHGRAVWVDDAAWEAKRHIRHLSCPGPGDERALLDLAARLISRPLPDDRPRWSAVFVSGLTEGKIGLILIVDHVISDGTGGLAALGCLVDGAPPVPADSFPQPPPTSAELRADAWRTWLRTAKATPKTVRGLASSLGSARRALPARAADCSLLTATGSQRTFAIARGHLDAVHAAAHLRGATVNDAVLAVIAGALSTLLAQRGEHVDEFVASVPVSVRVAGNTSTLGNRIDAMLVAVPASGIARLSDIAVRTRAARTAASAGVGSFAWLGALFRVAAKTGLMRAYLTRQHLIHTVVSNVRGPQVSLRFGGHEITDIIPISVGEAGNVTATFVAFSYAGKLTITITADPEHVHDLPVLEQALRSELALLERAATDEARH